jgi:flagellar hook protein FlgE
MRQTSITVYDTQGGKHDLTITFTKTSTANEWDYEITANGEDTTAGFVNDTGTVTFNQDGTLASPETVDFEFTPLGFSGSQTVTINFGTADTIDGLSQFASSSTAVLRDQDGYTMGLLERISVDAFGTITGAFSNGTTLTLAQVVLADFNNPSGLIRAGDNMYAISPNSGEAVMNFAGEGSQSSVTSGALEMSNVDLAQEFTSMITAQRGFQSNARVITTSDEMLQELVNLKR